LRELRDEDRPMLVSTHDLGSLPEFCDRTVLVKGTVLATARPPRSSPRRTAKSPSAARRP
jgi:ABC-type Mn2+/Zn2+ transport system ATPase subunit